MKATIKVDTDKADMEMARHDGIHLPLLLWKEMLNLLKEYKQFEQGNKDTRFQKYHKFFSKDKWPTQTQETQAI